jgi:hypothetical protein
MFTSRSQISGENQNVNMANRYSGKAVQLKYFGTTPKSILHSLEIQEAY